MLSSVVTPLLLAFDFGPELNFLYYVDKILNSIFMVDIVLTFFMATQNEDTFEIEVRHWVKIFPLITELFRYLLVIILSLGFSWTSYQ